MYLPLWYRPRRHRRWRRHILWVGTVCSLWYRFKSVGIWIGKIGRICSQIKFCFSKMMNIHRNSRIDGEQANTYRSINCIMLAAWQLNTMACDEINGVVRLWHIPTDCNGNYLWCQQMRYIPWTNLLWSFPGKMTISVANRRFIAFHCISCCFLISSHYVYRVPYMVLQI